MRADVPTTAFPPSICDVARKRWWTGQAAGQRTFRHYRAGRKVQTGRICNAWHLHLWGGRGSLLLACAPPPTTPTTLPVNVHTAHHHYHHLIAAHCAHLPR